MHVTGSADPWIVHGAGGADLPITPQERFVTRAYASLDEAIARGLDRLRRRDGIIPACGPGCSYCCRNHIVTNIAEAHALTQHITRTFSSGRIRSLRMRAKRWHEWNAHRPRGDASDDIRGRADFSRYDHCCPLLVHGTCSAYPVRPIVCRTHYVRSHPRLCREANNPGSAFPPPTAIPSIIEETHRFSETLREYIERAGLDSSRSTLLLPHWLAIQMGWDFAVTP